ncbi:MAG: hypothetical protein QXQ81_05505, partial [Candidatus Thorarchaeota archaeon]
MTVKSLTDCEVSRCSDGKIALRKLLTSMNISDGTPVLGIGTRSNFVRLIFLDTDVVALVRVFLEFTTFRTTAKTMLQQIGQSNVKIIHSTG